jgi:hypothetical protein
MGRLNIAVGNLRGNVPPHLILGEEWFYPFLITSPPNFAKWVWTSTSEGAA